MIQGCGFRPLYETENKQHHKVYIIPIKDREGQILRNELQKTFFSGAKTPQTPYLLKVDLEILKSELGFRRDETSRRIRLTLKATYHLIDRSTKNTLLSQTSSVLTGYSVGSSSSFASLPLIVSEKDAVKRGLAQLSHDIHLLVSSFLISLKEKSSGEGIAGDNHLLGPDHKNEA